MELFIIEHEFVTIKELCEKFGIHPNTARADVKEMADKGIVEKRYGGVAYITSRLPTSFNERQEKNIKSKEIIGQAAANLLEDDDIIYVDSGTTTLMLFNFPNSLPEHLTIITNSLDVVNWVFQNSDYTMFVLPGKENRQLNAFASLETIDSLKTYNVNKAFIGVRGISSKGNLSTASNIDAKIKSTAIEISEKVILMADSKKVNSTAMNNFSNLDDVDYWICDEATEEICDLARKHNVKLIEHNK